MSIKCYVCHHETEESREIAEQICTTFPYMKPYKLETTKLFESYFFMNVDIDESCKYIGMITYRVTVRPHVLLLNIGYVLSCIDSDVVTLNYVPPWGDKLTDSEKFHPGFKKYGLHL